MDMTEPAYKGSWSNVEENLQNVRTDQTFIQGL